MECGLGKTPLPEPKRVLACQESIAEAVPEAIVERALVIVAGVVLENVLDVGRIAGEEAMVRAGLQVNEVAVSIRGVEKGSDGIRPQLRKDSENRISAGSWRIPACRRTSRAGHVKYSTGGSFVRARQSLKRLRRAEPCKARVII
jgi:hypothetical protein